jgi:hypothetical protein
MRLLLALIALLALPAAAAAQQTGFEQRNGASWTTHEEELAFLQAVDAASERVRLEVIGETAEGRPLHLVRLGAPAPRGAGAVRSEPTALLVCSQHGNEPAGREACLITIRELATTTDPSRLALLRRASVLVVPNANPDGRARNSRTNTAGVDINRDHLTLDSPEARAIAAVVRDHEPEISLDLHEYGPSLPAVYDDEILYLWPRNLNVDDELHDHAEALGRELKEEAEAAGYSADEYGQYSLAENDIHQAAGDGDEGIMRNAMGLRHSLGILVETAVTEDVRNGVQEVLEDGALERRRVAAHRTVVETTLDELAVQGESMAATTGGAAARAPLDRRPVFFDGADNEAPTVVQDPAPCAYDLTAEQAAELRGTFDLLGIATQGTRVPMAQRAEPIIPLLLDERGLRHSAAGTPVACG